MDQFAAFLQRLDFPTFSSVARITFNTTSQSMINCPPATLISRFSRLTSIKIETNVWNELLQSLLKPSNNNNNNNNSNSNNVLAPHLKELHLPKLEKRVDSKLVLDVLAEYRELRVFEMGGDLSLVKQILEHGWHEHAPHITHLIVRTECM